MGRGQVESEPRTTQPPSPYHTRPASLSTFSLLSFSSFFLILFCSLLALLHFAHSNMEYSSLCRLAELQAHELQKASFEYNTNHH
jgi:hypothetical protein